MTSRLISAFLISLLFTCALFQPHHALAGSEQRVWISLTDPDDIYNETVLVFVDGASDSVDALYDTQKFTAIPGFDIYSKIGNADFKVQALPLLTSDKTVTIGIDAVTPGPYLFRLENLENIDPSVAILLEDTVTGTLQNMRLFPNGIIHHIDTAMNIQRFKVHFYPPFNFTSTNITCAGNPGAVHLSQPGSYAWNYEVKDAGNTIVDAGVAFNGIKTVDNLPEGIYTINLEDSYGYALTKQVVLDGKEPVVAQFEVSEEELQVGETLHFYDYSVGASNLRRNLGDGTVIEGDAFPSHTFAQAGEYEVIITASNTECADVMSKTITVLNHFTGIHDAEEEFVSIASSGNDLLIQFPNPQYAFADVQVFNLLGQKIIDEKVASIGRREFQIIGNGYFLVKVMLNRKSVEKKFFIQSW